MQDQLVTSSSTGGKVKTTLQLFGIGLIENPTFGNDVYVVGLVLLLLPRP